MTKPEGGKGRTYLKVVEVTLPQILAYQLTLPQSGCADNAHHTTTSTTYTRPQIFRSAAIPKKLRSKRALWSLSHPCCRSTVLLSMHSVLLE